MSLLDEFIWPFHLFVGLHILSGTVGLLAFWVPVIGRKGGARHKQIGRMFILSMLTTGAFASVMAGLTIQDPRTTHPHVLLSDETIEGIFGWMMLYLAILTVNLAWYGQSCARSRVSRTTLRSPVNIGLQVVLFAAAANCLRVGLQLNQFLMIGISTIGFATVATNLRFMLAPIVAPLAWQREHLKGLVGAGISVYTAFFAFGAVRIAPEIALNPILWSVPLATGLSIILFHWRRLWRLEAGFS